MLKSIWLRNFKCFEDKKFECNKLNIFAGYNGRGKSSVIQSLLLLSQSAYFGTGSLNKLHLCGALVDLGDFDEILYDDMNDTVVFGLETDDTQFKSVVFDYCLSDEDLKVASLQSCKINGSEAFDVSSKINDNTEVICRQEKTFSASFPTGFIGLLRNVHYISANRIGPIKYADKCEVPDLHRVYPTGFNVINVLASFKAPIQNMDPPNSSAQLSSLKELVPVWMQYIMGDKTGKVSLHGEKASPILSLKFAIENSKEFNQINVGFGYSYILSIVITALIAKPGAIVIIENPEAHLHGQAQSRLTELLAKIVEKGVQLFVETHSEHIVNGFRKEMLKDKCDLSTQDANVYFFDKDFSIEKLKINSNAEIDNWPHGFFDQEMNDLAEIARLGAKIK